MSFSLLLSLLCNTRCVQRVGNQLPTYLFTFFGVVDVETFASTFAGSLLTIVPSCISGYVPLQCQYNEMLRVDMSMKQDVGGFSGAYLIMNASVHIDAKMQSER
jgi:hypothetical protein